MNKRGKPSTKEELIAHYGIEWYENFKKRNKENSKAYYRNNREKELARLNAYHKAHNDERREYNRKYSEIGKIQCRDRNRIVMMGILQEGQEVHHMKYHKDNKDASWMDDIIIMSHDEHVQWHVDHPDFRAIDNLV